MKTRKRNGQMIAADTQSQTVKADDKLVRTTTRTEVYKRQVDFADVVDAVTIENDDNSETPWDSCDGFEHTVLRADDCENSHERAGYTWDEGNRRSIVIELDAGDCWEVAKYARANGASKQVAFELAAANKRATLAQLCKWYNLGWNWYGVTCDYLGAHASLWGIDDWSYAAGEVTQDIASEVADELELQGFEIINRPEPPKRYGKDGRWTLEGFRDHLKRNLASQTWRA